MGSHAPAPAKKEDVPAGGMPSTRMKRVSNIHSDAESLPPKQDDPDEQG